MKADWDELIGGVLRGELELCEEELAQASRDPDFVIQLEKALGMVAELDEQQIIAQAAAESTAQDAQQIEGLLHAELGMAAPLVRRWVLPLFSILAAACALLLLDPFGG